MVVLYLFNSLPVFDDLYYLACIASRLNSSLMKNALTAARRVVGHFKHSALATKQLQTFATTVGIKFYTLKRDVATRWSSTNTSLVTLKKMKPVLQIRSDHALSCVSCHSVT